jgi:hypothetical protein
LWQRDVRQRTLHVLNLFQDVTPSITMALFRELFLRRPLHFIQFHDAILPLPHRLGNPPDSFFVFEGLIIRLPHVKLWWAKDV